MKLERWNYTNPRGRQIGWVEDSTFHSTRDYKRNQIFKHPKYESAIAIDRAILKDLVAKKVTKIKILIKNFEKDSFWLELTTKEFLKHSFEINFKNRKKPSHSKPYGEQRAVPMKFWRRNYPTQQKLEIFIQEAEKQGVF